MKANQNVDATAVTHAVSIKIHQSRNFRSLRMSQKPLINHVQFRMGHHATVSGYDRLSDYLPAARVINTPTRLSLSQRLIAKAALPMIRGAEQQWYHRDNLLVELALALGWYKSGPQIIHFLYGENSYRYLGNLRGLSDRNRLVATFHTPPQRFREVVGTPKILQALDAIIVVSRIQREFLTGLVDSERVHFIPHGIDTEFFYPERDTHLAENARFVCVGSHLRDFDTLTSVSMLIGQILPEAKILVVARRAIPNMLAQLENVEVRSDLTDEELRKAYQESTALLLPLLDATANNALLEAMACGLPILTTDLVGTRDYLNEECAYFAAPRDAQRLAKGALELVNEPDRRASMGRASRRRANLIRWQSIATETQALYDSLW